MKTTLNKTFTRTLIVTGVAVSMAASAFSGAALAQGKGQPGANAGAGPRQGMMRMMDTNKDGEISAEERSAGIARMAEFRMAPMIAPFDGDGDGKISKAEMEDFTAKLFALLDRNNDGQIDAKEATLLMPWVKSMNGDWGHHRHMRGHHRHHGKWQHGNWHRGGKMMQGNRGMSGQGNGAAGTPPAVLDNGRDDDSDEAQ